LKILVTGGAGFIGSHVVDAFLKEGHDVVVVDNLTTGKTENIPEKARFVQADIRDNELNKLFADEHFDLVDHFAGQIDVRRSVADPVNDSKINITGSVHILELCRIYSVKRFIFASTGGAIYGQQEHFPADENHPRYPISPYGIDKLAVENYLYWYFRNYGISCIALRYGNVYGPRQNPFGEAGVIAIWCHRMLANNRPVIYGDGRQTRDFTYISDVVRANLLAVQSYGFRVYNIGTGIETNINTIFRSLNKIFYDKFEEIHEPAQPGEQLRSSINPTKAGKELNWKPEVTLDDGLHQTVEFFKDEI